MYISYGCVCIFSSLVFLRHLPQVYFILTHIVSCTCILFYIYWQLYFLLYFVKIYSRFENTTKLVSLKSTAAGPFYSYTYRVVYMYYTLHLLGLFYSYTYRVVYLCTVLHLLTTIFSSLFFKIYSRFENTSKLVFLTSTATGISVFLHA